MENIQNIVKDTNLGKRYKRSTSILCLTAIGKDTTEDRSETIDLVHPDFFPPLSKERVDEIDRWLKSIKPWFPLPQDQYQCWKLLKKYMPIFYQCFQPPHFKHEEEMQMYIAFDVVSKHGICIDLWYEINYAR